MKEQFIEKVFYRKAQEGIRNANRILDAYKDQGFTLTVRQLHYQFVASNLYKNTKENYDWLVTIVTDGRLAGLIDWEAIEDRTRNLVTPSTWDNPGSILHAVGSQYAEDLWKTQVTRIEVLVEKEALVGVVERACEPYQVPFLACKGYLSSSEMYSAGKRLARIANGGQRVLVLHLGDHDPSGIDMTRDNIDRLSLFMGDDIELRRIALNMDQVEEHKPPPNFAKSTDSRFADYRARFGEDSWELDALNPAILVELIQSHILAEIDMEAFDAARAESEERRAGLAKIANRWQDALEWAENEED